MHTSWVSFTIGLGLLFLLGTFVLLVNRRSTLTLLGPSTPIASSTQNATTRILITQEHSTASSTTPIGVMSPTLSITSTVDTKVSNSALEGWQQFSSDSGRYTFSHPPAAIIRFKPSPPLVEHTQISFAASKGTPPPLPPFDIMFIDITVYENSTDKSIEEFVSEFYAQAFQKPITAQKLQELMSRPVKVDSTIGYWMDWRRAGTRMQFLISYKKHLYQFALIHQFSSVKLDDDELAIFNRIVHTIRLQ